MRLKHRRKTIQAGEVKITYDPKNDSIVLTPKSRPSHPDEYPGKLVVPGSSEDEHARQFLFEAGIIAETPWPELDRTALLSRVFSPENPDRIILGTGKQGQDVLWDLNGAPNLWVYSDSRGVNRLQRALFYHALAQGWDYYGIDLLRVQLSEFARYRGTTRTIAQSSSEVRELLGGLQGLMEERLKEASVLGSRVGAPTPVLLAVDNLQYLLNGLESEDLAERRLAEESFVILDSLGRSGGAVGIHLAVCSMRSFTGAPLSCLGSKALYAVIGKVDSEDLPEVLHGYEGDSYGRRIARRGLVVGTDERTEIELPELHTEDGLNWVREHGSERESELWAELQSTRGEASA